MNIPDRLIAMRDIPTLQDYTRLNPPSKGLKQGPGLSYSRTNHQHDKDDDAGSSITRVVPWGVCVLSGDIIWLSTFLTT